MESSALALVGQGFFAVLAALSIYATLVLRDLPDCVALLMTRPLPRLILFMMIYFISLAHPNMGLFYTTALLVADQHVYRVISKP